MILAGLVVWLAAGVIGARLSAFLRVSGAGTEAFTIAWGILGAFLGGVVGLIPSLPEHGFPWRAGGVAGALIGAVALSLLYRLLRRRSGRQWRPATRRTGLALLAIVATGLAAFTWFILALATPRLYKPKFNPAVEAVLNRSCGRDTALVGPCMTSLAKAYLSRPENAGVVIGAWLNGERVLVTGGVGSRREGTPINAGSLFEVGSITKVFTGLALARAVTKGEVRLDQRLVELLPGGEAAELRGLPITLEDLATQHAGLPRAPAALPWWTGVVYDNPLDRLTEHALIESLAEATGKPSAAKSYAYSNFGFLLLGDALERAAGIPFPRLLTLRVFQPLGMYRTRAPYGDSLVDGPVEGYSLGQPMPHWIGQRFAGAAGVVSCANDMLTLIEAEIRLQPDSLRAPLLLAGTERRKVAADHAIGLGWEIGVDRNGRRFVHHDGSTPGFFAYVGYSAESRVGVVVLANSSDPTVVLMGSRLLALLSEGKPWPASNAADAAPTDSARRWTR